MSRFAILHVCTGNICRSPIAERLTVAALDRRLGPAANAFAVSSAGTWGHVDSAMEPYAVTVLAERGVDGTDFRARELDTEAIAAADLVLTATRDHRAAVVTMAPAALARTFTLREFARVSGAVAGDANAVAPIGAPIGAPAGADLVERARAVVRRAAAGRGALRPPTLLDDDIADPYAAALTTFRARADEIAAAVERTVAALVGDAEPGAAGREGSG